MIVVGWLVGSYHFGNSLIYVKGQSNKQNCLISFAMFYIEGKTLSWL